MKCSFIDLSEPCLLFHSKLGHKNSKEAFTPAIFLGANSYVNYSHNYGLHCTKWVHSHMQLSKLLQLQCNP